MVELRFANRELFERCRREADRIAAYGPRVATALRLRLGQLSVIESLEELSLLPCDAKEAADGTISVTILSPLQLLLHAVFDTDDNPRRLVALEIIDIREAGEIT